MINNYLKHKIGFPIALIVLCIIPNSIFAQDVLINETGGTPDASAALEIQSTKKGLLIPRLTTTQMNAISSPSTGLLIYNTSESSFKYYNGTIWQNIVSGNTVDSTQILSTNGSNKTTKVSVSSTANNIDFIQQDTTFWRMNRHTLEPFQSGRGVFIGQSAGNAMDNSSNNSVFIGFESGKNTTTGSESIGVGYGTLENLTSGVGNVAIGSNVLNNITTASGNTGVGYYTLHNTSTGSNNSAFGRSTLNKTTTGTSNSAFGRGSMESNETGSQNSAVGTYSLTNNVTGGNNVAFGYLSLGLDTGGSSNVAVGHRAMYTHKDGSDNVAIGKAALELNVSGVGNVAIGYQAGRSETGSNKLYIENSNSTSPLIYGDFSSDIAAINGNLGVGTMSPTALLTLAGVGTPTARINTYGSVLSDASVLYLTKARGTETTPTAVVSQDVLSRINSVGYDGSAYQSAARIKMVVDGVPGTNDMPGRLEFHTTPDGSSTSEERMRIDNEGKVGIGTDSPTAKLHLTAKGPASAASGQLQIDNDFGSSMMLGRATSYGFVQTQNSHPLVLNPISNNVGIGTTSPNTTLHVYGSADASLTNDGITLFGIKTGANMVLDANEIMVRNNGATASLYLQNDGGDLVVGGTKFFVDGTSGVGIGTTSPSEELDVEGDIQIDGDYKYESAKTSYASFHSSAFIMSATNTNVHAYRQYLTSGSSGVIRVATQGGNISNEAYLIAAVQLPHGATVTEISCLMRDVNGTYDGTVRLVRQTHAAGFMAEMASVTTSGSGGNQTLTDTSIANGVISNSTYAYSLVFETREATTQIMLNSVIITYTTTKAQ